MNASATVSLTLRGLRVGSEQVIATVTREQQAARDVAGLLTPSALSLGAAGAAAALLAALAERRGSAHLAGVARAFEGEREAARAEVDAWADRPEAEGYAEHAVRVRAWCIELGVRAAHAAVAATGGSANLLDNAAQRLFREAMLYSLTSQTRDLQAATVQRLLATLETGSDGAAGTGGLALVAATTGLAQAATDTTTGAVLFATGAGRGAQIIQFHG